MEAQVRSAPLSQSRRIVDALYDASSAGVKIRLNVRGICCLRPGKKGLSENIEVVSIVDRFLEHARILHFCHNGDHLVYISSADWMPRNLDRRIELLIPIQDRQCQQRLIKTLNTYFSDNCHASRLMPDGQYVRKQAKKNRTPFRAQESLYREASELMAAFSNPKATVFKAHRG